MIELTSFHTFILTASLMYYFKFSKDDETYYTENYRFISDMKSRITGELAQSITTLTNSNNRIIVKPKKDDGLEIELATDNMNPIKSEKFKNWLDDYLDKKTSFFFLCSDFKRLYLSWKKWSKFSRLYSMILAILQIISIVLCFYWSKLCPEGNFAKLACIDSDDNALYCLGLPSLVLVILGLIIIFYKNLLKDNVVEIRDGYHDL